MKKVLLLGLSALLAVFSAACDQAIESAQSDCKFMVNDTTQKKYNVGVCIQAVKIMDSEVMALASTQFYKKGVVSQVDVNDMDQRAVATSLERCLSEVSGADKVSCETGIEFVRSFYVLNRSEAVNKERFKKERYF